MDMLTQLRQDSGGFIASALADRAAAPSPSSPSAPAVPGLMAYSPIAPPVEFEVELRSGRWPVVQFHEGDWGKVVAGRPAALGGDSRQPAASAATPPTALAAPCPDCGSPFFWEDLAGEVHCCECVAIPSRRMAKEAWEVRWQVQVAGGVRRAVWAIYQPVHWRPFAHLETSEQSLLQGRGGNGGSSSPDDF